MKLSKAIAIPAFALAAGLSLAACGSQAAPSAAPTYAITAAPAPTTPAPTTAAPTTPAPAPAKTVYVQVPAAPAPAAAPALTNCGSGANGGEVYAGPDTSCPFAQNVAANWTGPGADYAYSPVTGLNYTMNCTDSGGGQIPLRSARAGTTPTSRLTADR